MILILNRNKDFLKEVFSGTKALMSLDEVKRVNMPMYDEVSVKDMWPKMQGNAEFMRYFPSKFPKGRLPDRSYFFNIMATVMGDYVKEIIRHANEIRATKAHDAEAI